MYKQLVKSKYLQIISLDDRYSLIYHSLYGNLVKVSNGVINILDEINAINNHNENSYENYYKVVTYLKDKKFIISEGEDEYSAIRAKLVERPEKLSKGELIGEIQLSVSNMCNMNCKYCFEKKFDKQIRDWSSKISFDTAKNSITKVLTKIKENGRDHFSINFFGGEPLTNAEVIKQVLEYFGNGEKWGININYSIDTNGILISEEIAELFAKYRVLVNLSIDYLSGGEMYRADGANGATFTQFDRSLKLLKSKGVTTYFLSVLSADTFNKFGNDLLNYAKEHNVQGNDVILAFELDFQNTITIDEVVKKLVEYYDYGRKINIHVGGYWGNIIEQMERQSLRNIEGFKCCPAIGRRLSIEPSGDVFGCKSSSKAYGNMEDFEGVLNSKEYHENGMRAFRNSHVCEGCIIEGFCSGACIGHLEKWYGNITSMDPFLCDIYRKLTMEILKVKYMDS